jgi:hypothetical protein
LFFFEGGFFLLAILGLALAEFWGRGQALGFWLLVTALSLLGRSLALARLGRTAPAERADLRWRRAVADSWRHFNVLLLLGLVAIGAWWWIEAGGVG